MKQLKPLDLSDFELVELKSTNSLSETPHCKKHGAMNKVSVDGFWRCISTVAIGKDNNCRAGCVY